VKPRQARGSTISKHGSISATPVTRTRALPPRRARIQRRTAARARFAPARPLAALLSQLLPRLSAIDNLNHMYLAPAHEPLGMPAPAGSLRSHQAFPLITLRLSTPLADACGTAPLPPYGDAASTGTSDGRRALRGMGDVGVWDIPPALTLGQPRTFDYSGVAGVWRGERRPWQTNSAVQTRPHPGHGAPVLTPPGHTEGTRWLCRSPPTRPATPAFTDDL